MIKSKSEEGMAWKPFVYFFRSGLNVELVLTVHNVCLNASKYRYMDGQKGCLTDNLLKYLKIVYI